MSYYRDQLETWLKTLHIKAERVYDVGGADKPVNTRLGSFQAPHYDILDNADGAGFDLNLDMLQMMAFADKQADVVFCFEVMEYIYNPAQALENLANLTKQGGDLYITFQFVYPIHKPVADDVLRYTPTGARLFLKNAGFAIVEEWERVDRSGKLAEFYKADGMHVADKPNLTGLIIHARKV